MNFTFLRNWGRFSDRFSNKPVAGLCGSLFMSCFLAFAFTTMPERYIMTTPLLVVIHVFMGISTAGVTLASGNIRLKLSPKGQATSYLAVNSTFNSFEAGIAPVFGGKFVDFFATRQLSLILKWTSPGHGLPLKSFTSSTGTFFPSLSS